MISALRVVLFVLHVSHQLTVQAHKCVIYEPDLPAEHSSSFERRSQTAGGPRWHGSAEREDSVHQSDTGGQLYLSALAVRRAASVWVGLR